MAYILNVETKKLHNAENPCHRGKNICDKNKRIFDTLDEAAAFVGEGRHFEKCGFCFKTKKERK